MALQPKEFNVRTAKAAPLRNDLAYVRAELSPRGSPQPYELRHLGGSALERALHTIGVRGRGREEPGAKRALQLLVYAICRLDIHIPTIASERDTNSHPARHIRNQSHAGQCRTAAVSKSSLPQSDKAPRSPSGVNIPAQGRR